MENTFNSIYEQYYRKSFLFVKSYVHHDMAAEDIASEALIKLWQLMKEQPVEHVASLLLAILKNMSLDYLRRQAVKQQVMGRVAEKQDAELALRIASLEECDPNEIFSKEVMEIVHCTLQALPEQTRRVFSLSRFEEKTNREIALELGISVKSVEYHITKSLKALKSSLKDYLPLFYFFFFY